MHCKYEYLAIKIKQNTLFNLSIRTDTLMSTLFTILSADLRHIDNFTKFKILKILPFYELLKW